MSKVPPETLELIAAANDIVEVIGSYFPLKRAGVTFKALCPFHQEKSPSFTVNPQRQIFKCFGCGAGGGVFKFVELYENLSFPEAIKKLADRAGIKLIEEEPTEEENRKYRMRKRLLTLHQEAADWFHRNLLKTQAAKGARDYLKGRGITGEIAKSWKIGFAPDSWEAFGNWAQGQGYTDEELVRSGLSKMKEQDENTNIASLESVFRITDYYDRFRDRVMFPICNDYGEVIAFSGRVLNSEAKGAKYLNSPETILFTKSKVLFGLHKSKRAIIDKNSAIVCEGQLDQITAFEAGIKNVIASQGTAFTQTHANILKRYAEEVVLCFDADAAGQNAAEKSLPSLLAANLFVRVAQMPPGHDPDSLIRELGPEAFLEQIKNAKDFFDFQIESQTRSPEFATPRGKIQFAKKMAGFTSLLSDVVLRDEVIGKITARMEISAQDFRRMLSVVRNDDKQTEESSPTQTLKLSTLFSLLSVLALRNNEARTWLLSQSWGELLCNNEEEALLAKILQADLKVDDPHSTSVLLATLTSEEESVVSSLLLQKPPSNPEVVVQDCWSAFERSALQRRRGVVESRLRMPDLSSAELQALQKEVMDLKNREDQIAKRNRRHIAN